MDSKITLSFDREVIRRMKRFADANNISLSRLTEFLYKKIISGNYRDLEELPIADWVQQVAEGPVVYRSSKRGRKAIKSEFFESKK